MSLEFVVIGGAVLLLLLVLETVRRRYLTEGYALVWIAFAVGGVILGIARPVVDRLSSALGVAYGTSLVFSLVLLFLIIVAVNLSVHMSRLERRVEVLAQELALRDAAGEPDPTGEPPSLTDPADGERHREEGS